MHSWHEVSLANIFDMSVPGDSNGESVPKKATKSGAMRTGNSMGFRKLDKPKKARKVLTRVNPFFSNESQDVAHSAPRAATLGN